ncbi:acetyl-CoA synthetase-like protein [Lichtheimia hyalospora FSU 10163]|nr:acetyl-CoA synthetase-like protein [Lichtheimia hyalospora FSU 10163]
MTTPVSQYPLPLLPFHEPTQYHAFINLFRYLAIQYKTNTCIYYQGDNASFHSLTYGQVDHISTNLACQWASFLLPHHRDPRPVGFLADHSVDYFIYLVAILKLRVPFLALSPRNSNMAIAHLLEKSNAELVIASEKYIHQAMDACNIVKTKYNKKLSHQLLEPLNLEKMIQEPLHPCAHTIINTRFTKDDENMPMLITHSSGTTSFPKLVAHTNEYFMLMAQTFVYDFQNMQQKPKFTLRASDVLLNTFPLFHIAGMEQTFAALVHGSSCVFLSHPLAQPTDLVHAMKQCPVTYAALPPLMLDDIVMYLKNTANYEPFQQLKYITQVFAGAPLRQNVGDFLAAHDIRLQSVVGCTEIGVYLLNDFIEKRAPWNACRPCKLVAEYCMWEPFDELLDVYHLVIKAGCPKMSPRIANRVNGDFATNDLFMEDPPGSGYWCHLGRIDDTLLMLNGEKTNPTPMEQAIRASYVVKHCLVIGENRPCTGVLVELKDHLVSEQQDIKEQGMMVHAAVATANKDAPNHSRILPHMVYILPIHEHLPLNAKGNVVRKETMKQFEDIIESMYDGFQGTSSMSNVSKISDANILSNDHQLESFLCNEVAGVLGKEPSLIAANKDLSLFDLGLNSLLVVHLRNIITKELTIPIPSNFIYENPSIRAIVHGLRKQEQASTSYTSNSSMESSYKETQALLERYLARAKRDFQACVAIQHQHHDHVVLLTGATGSLGSFMLCDLIQSSRVSKIYCTVRAQSKAAAMNRIRQSFCDRMLDISLLNHVKVEALPTDLNATYFGWDKDTYHRLGQEVTMIQACGWLVDFNQSITHFDRECIQGLYNLLKFAHHPIHPMYVHTISSISAAAAMSTHHSIPETIPPQDPHVALPIGYAQSKYIVEHLFDYLTREKRFPCIIERMGQLCGDTIHGAWSINEQFPLMMMGGGDKLHMMPDLKGTMVDWLPVDYASSTIVDIMLKTSARFTPEDLVGRVFHIVNPNRVTWSHVLKSMHGCGMDFQVVEPEEWVMTLQKHQANPAYRLLSYYQDVLLQGNNQVHETIWETKHTTALVKKLTTAPVLDTKLMSKYYRFWKSYL